MDFCIRFNFGLIPKHLRTNYTVNNHTGVLIPFRIRFSRKLVLGYVKFCQIWSHRPVFRALKGEFLHLSKWDPYRLERAGILENIDKNKFHRIRRSQVSDMLIWLTSIYVWGYPRNWEKNVWQPYVLNICVNNPKAQLRNIGHTLLIPNVLIFKSTLIYVQLLRLYGLWLYDFIL